MSIQIHVLLCRYLHNNTFNGTIPTQVAQLTALEVLYVMIVPGGVRVHSDLLLRRGLSTNQFSGTIPTQVAQLTKLKVLYVVISLVVFRVLSDSRASSQGLRQQSIDWHNSDTCCAIDGAQLFCTLRLSVVFRNHVDSRASSQDIVRQSIDRHNCDTSCAIDGAPELVRLNVLGASCPSRFTCFFAGTWRTITSSDRFLR
jgi:hypothetical protein